jgi:FkbM family methyltransferase
MREDLVRVDGDWWPSKDTQCRPAIMETYKDADAAINLCPKRRVAVQAGGNCGIWPRHLAKRFETVYTFEPDPVNFRCLALNATARNIVKMQAALGFSRQPVSLLRTPANAGAHRVEGAGHIPQIRLDDLTLPACDLLQLDIEGFEYFALRGAEKTVARDRPVLMLEDKGHHRKYGVAQHALAELLAAWDYRPYKKVHRDVIMLPAESPFLAPDGAAG